jgi:hypothetical protein
MSDTPKFTVVDRRKYKAEEEEHEAAQTPAPPATATPAAAAATPPAGPRLVETPSEASDGAAAEAAGDDLMGDIPAPTAEETKEQKTAYDASAQRLEDLVRAQNPGIGASQGVTFEQLIQQFYVSSMIQMGAATPEGQRPQVDILGARQTIDLLGLLDEKTRGNLTDAEDRMLKTVLYEARMTFLELTRMITLKGVQAPAPPPKPNK